MYYQIYLDPLDLALEYAYSFAQLAIKGYMDPKRFLSERVVSQSST